MVRQLGLARAVGAWALLMVVALVLATSAKAAALSQGYKTATTLDAGSVVALDQKTPGTILAANSHNAGELLGLVVGSSESVLSVSDSGTNVQVVTSGLATALVSDLNGQIKKGDPVTISPINGLAMKASVSGKILGYAQSDFAASSPGAVAKTIKTESGRSQQVSLGSIPVQVSITYLTITTHSAIPAPLQSVIDSVAGRNVSTIRVVLGSLIVVFSLIVIAILVNSAVTSSINSLGRNPLAKRAVSGGLAKVLVLALAILLVALGSVYFIIRG